MGQVHGMWNAPPKIDIGRSQVQRIIQKYACRSRSNAPYVPNVVKPLQDLLLYRLLAQDLLLDGSGRQGLLLGLLVLLNLLERLIQDVVVSLAQDGVQARGGRALVFDRRHQADCPQFVACRFAEGMGELCLHEQ